MRTLLCILLLLPAVGWGQELSNEQRLDKETKEFFEKYSAIANAVKKQMAEKHDTYSVCAFHEYSTDTAIADEIQKDIESEVPVAHSINHSYYIGDSLCSHRVIHLDNDLNIIGEHSKREVFFITMQKIKEENMRKRDTTKTPPQQER